MHPLFPVLMFIVICVNVILLAIDGDPPFDAKILNILCNYVNFNLSIELINFTITWMFLAEVLIKIIGLGIKEFKSNA